MTNDEQFMIECITTELISYVMRDFHKDMEEAMDNQTAKYKKRFILSKSALCI